MERFTTDGLRALLASKGPGAGSAGQRATDADGLDSMGNTGLGPPGPLGLEQGEGSGNTAAGSPFGDRIGAPLWLYRVKYSGGDWDANPKAIPALLREVKLALNLKKVGTEEVVRMTDLPGHRGPNMPSMLFMSGTGAIESTEAEQRGAEGLSARRRHAGGRQQRRQLRAQFTRFMNAVLPGKPFRPIEFDHDVYRGHGCRTNWPAAARSTATTARGIQRHL